MAKKLDPLKEKQRKQKILAAVLGVVFLGLLAFMGPRTWKQLHPPPTPVSRATTTTSTPPAGTPSLAAPTLQGAQGPPSTPTPGGAGSLVSTPAVQDGQLASFSRFASKDPFAQQLSEHPAGTGGSTGSTGSSGSSGSGSSSSGGTPSIPGNQPAPGSAVISVNGTLYDVTVGTDFPQATTDPSVVPLFHLVSLTAHSAKISIAGGSYANGSKTVTLRENKPLILMNTADGTRYKLILKPQGTSATGSTDGGTTTTSPTTVTLPPATP